ncbi:prepilin-type N-terminal cleavage/methylation domain-containing protein [Denitratisoma oestradiolicum]|uniref:Putative Prepilin-type cleavage/methylation domain-containing protein n=1 Tax=Denitratisoma oestradiolicum TaxID=311182 RepID=A0A6S6Y3E9_9PROT|nr:prepilin-type N-terminal cleavage/methylation domain-containing protein [Denitratisoma oestradiolicum]CAB1369917.1 putative Prepilin-type cleavage/methylation domain-containing protein [Denitratisoma oestradiolicum]
MNPPALAPRGFTLTELAVVLVIVSLLLGSLLLPLGIQQDARAQRETAQAMETAGEALIGFALVQSRLPCPDSDRDGLENCDATAVDAVGVPSSGLCTRSVGRCVGGACEGGLPFATLGLPAADSWSSRYRYRVSSPFIVQTITVHEGVCGDGPIVSTHAGINLSASGDITLRTRGDDPATTGTVESRTLINMASQVPAVIISAGKNRYGGISADGSRQAPAPPPENSDETTNASIGNIKIVRTIPAPDTRGCDDGNEARPPCEFDDVVVWLSQHVLFNRLIAAGRLP